MVIRSALLIFTMLCALPLWTLTLKPEDIKYCFSFCAVLFFLVASVKKHTPSPSRNYSVFPIIIIALFVGYVLYILINWYLLSTPYYGMRGMAYQWLCLMAFIIGVTFLSNAKSLNTVLNALIVTGVISSIYAFAEYFALIPGFYAFDWPPRITGLFDNRNVFSVMIVLATVIALYFLKTAIKSKLRIAYGCAVLLFLSTMAINDSRGIFILAGFCAVAIAVPLILKSNSKTALRQRFALYAGVLIIGVVVILFWDEAHWLRMVSITQPFQDISVQGRFEVYRAAWQVFLNHPVFGCGIGNFIHAYVPFFSHDATFPYVMLNFSLAQHAECDYLETLCETGIVGTVFWIFFILGAAIVQIKGLIRQWQWKEYLLLVVYGTLLINGIYDTSLRFMPTGLLLWILAGRMWGPLFRAGIERLPQKAIAINKLLLVCITLIVTAFFFQIILSDFFYLRYIRQKQAASLSAEKSLSRALAIFSAQPDALYCKALNAFTAKNYKQTWELADLLDKIAPNYRTTDYLRASVLAENSQPLLALTYVDRAIKREPVDLNLKGFKIAILSNLGRCDEAGRLKDSLGIARVPHDSTTTPVSEPTIEELMVAYTLSTDAKRRAIGGPFLFNAYKKHRDRVKHNGQTDNGLIRRIEKISCE